MKANKLILIFLGVFSAGFGSGLYINLRSRDVFDKKDYSDNSKTPARALHSKSRLRGETGSFSGKVEKNIRDSEKDQQKSIQATRYQNLLEILAKRNETLPFLSFSNTFEPDREIATFFGLSEEEGQHLIGVCGYTMESIKRRETANSRILKSDGNTLSYEIPADKVFAAEAKLAFTQEVESILGEEGANLMQGAIENQFEQFNNKRVFTVSVNHLKNEVNEYKYIIETFDNNGESLGTTKFSDFLKDGKIPDPSSVQGRFAHLVNFK